MFGNTLTHINTKSCFIESFRFNCFVALLNQVNTQIEWWISHFTATVLTDWEKSYELNTNVCGVLNLLRSNLSNIRRPIHWRQMLSREWRCSWGRAPTDNAPTTPEWSTVALPTKVAIISRNVISTTDRYLTDAFVPNKSMALPKYIIEPIQGTWIHHQPTKTSGNLLKG